MQPPTPTNIFKTGVRAGGEEIACQRKYIGGEDRYGRYSTTYRIESPQKVGRVFYPAGHAPAGSDTGLAYAARQVRQDTITATAKDDSPGTCDWDKDGRPNCNVSVNPSSIDLADTGWTEPQAPISENMRNFLDAAAAVEAILLDINSCSRFFKGAGLDALNEIVSSLRSAGDRAFQPADNSSLGIRMGVLVQVNPNDDLARRATTSGAYSVTAIGASGIIINTRGSFVRSTPLAGDRLPYFGGYSPGSLQSRVLQLLHEIGHLVVTGTRVATRQVTVGNEVRSYQQIAFDLLFPVDSGNPSLSEQNTRRVLNNCTSQIEGLAGLSRNGLLARQRAESVFGGTDY